MLTNVQKIIVKGLIKKKIKNVNQKYVIFNAKLIYFNYLNNTSRQLVSIRNKNKKKIQIQNTLGAPTPTVEILNLEVLNGSHMHTLFFYNF